MSEAHPPARMPRWMQDHVRRYLASDGADGHLLTFPPGSARQVPTLLLTVIGRRTGSRYLIPLAYLRAGESLVVVASRGGAAADPHWYRNLRANPEVTLQVGSQQLQARARTAAGVERAALWRRLIDAIPDFADYQRRAWPREIPVVVLEPIQPPPGDAR